MPSESSKQMSMDNGVEVDNRKDGSTSSSTTWRSCDSRRWKQRIVLNGEGEPEWLTSHERDLQPEGERERERVSERIFRRNCNRMKHLNTLSAGHSIKQQFQFRMPKTQSY